MLSDRNRVDGTSSMAARAPAPGEEQVSCAQQLSGLLHRFRLDFYLVSAFPGPHTPTFAANLVASNWPAGLIETYDRRGVYKESELIRRLGETVRPVSFAEWPFVDVRRGGKVVPIDVSGGFERTLAFAIRGHNRDHLIFAFSGRRRPLDESEIAALYLSCLTLVDSGLSRSRPQPLPTEKLSMRELDCLRWAAEGKSSDEIAVILDISAHTVVSYLKNAMRKLDAVNRMQAIARACRLELI